MNTAIRTLWTAKDEATLADLTDRKHRVMNANRDALREVLARNVSLPLAEFECLIDGTISDAEQLRDALLPFDSREQRA